MNLMKIPYRTAHLMKKSTLNLLKLPVPPTLTGPGMIHRFPEIISLCDVHKLLIVTGSFAAESGLLNRLTNALNKSEIEAVAYAQVDQEPTYEAIYNGLELYFTNQCDGIIALGGGSAIDCAKLIAAKVTNDRPLPKMAGLFKLAHRLPPLFAIPTTAGSGAEATITACVTDSSRHEKAEISDPKLVPLAVLLDAEMLAGLNSHQMAWLGMGAFALSVEAYISRYDTSFIRDKALNAVKAIDTHLSIACADLTDLSAHQALLQAAFDTGLACTRAGGGYISAGASVLSAWYGMPYNLAAAMLLPVMLEASCQQAMPSLGDLALTCGLGEPFESPELLSRRFIKHIRTLSADLGLPTVLSVLRRDDVPELSHRIVKKVNAHYPVPQLLSPEGCASVLLRLLEND